MHTGPEDDAPDLTVVVVTYRSSGTVGRCLRSLPAALADLRGRVVIVDNASDDDTLAVVRALGEELPVPVEVIEQATNAGFSAGCNLGLRRAAGRWVLFLNPDTQCPPGSLWRLVEVAAACPAAGIVAPALVGPDGQLQPTVERTYGLGRVLLGMARIGGANRPAPPPPSGPPVEVPWVHAAVILMPLDLARELGGFDAGFFMYAEDMDLCTRVRAAGRSVLVAPEVRVEHVGGASAALSGGEATTAARRVESLGRYLAKHQGRWAAVVAGLATGGGAGARALSSWARRRPDPVELAKVRAAWRVVVRHGGGNR